MSEQEKLLPCPFCGSSDIEPEGVASFKEEHRSNDSKFGWDNYEPHMIEHRPCCNKCGATTDGDWNIRKTTSNENKELGITPCRCGGGAVKEVVEPHKHELAKWMPDYEGGVFVSCGKCSAMTSSVEDWNAIMASRPQPAIEGDVVEAAVWPDFVAPPKYENPCAGWEDPALPDFRLIWKVARECGYAVGLHGSMKRDCDLIAVPWVENAGSAEKLISSLCAALNAKMIGDFENKPHGRIACILQIDTYVKHIDLSIIAAMQPAIDKAVAEERARCVKVCNDLSMEPVEPKLITIIKKTIEQGGGDD